MKKRTFNYGQANFERESIPKLVGGGPVRNVPVESVFGPNFHG